MCSGSKSKVTSFTGESMEGDCITQKQEKGFCKNSSVLLELSAVDDLEGFKRVVQEEGHNVNEPSSWYGRKFGSKKFGFEERTPLMIAAMFGSKYVLSYILQSGSVDVNRSCGSDGATALHFAAASGSSQSHEIVKLMLDSSADISSVDANGCKPCDVIALSPSPFSKLKKILEIMLRGEEVDQESCAFDQVIDKQPMKKEYPNDPSLPDIKNGICSTDEFRMYTFKVRPCSRAYSHDWTECPFVHPGENARRRDPRKYHYSCVPCPEFRKGSCIKGDSCEYAHGIFECWLHPAQYRTRLCKDETNCPRRVCFFAHKVEELRPLYASTGSAVMSPRSINVSSPFDMASLSPRRRMQQLEELGSLSSPCRWNNTSLISNSLNDVFRYVDPVVLSQSPTGIQIRHNMNQQIRSTYPSGIASSPVEGSSLFGVDPSGSTAAAVLSSRSSAFAKRSQSFIDRGAINRLSGISSPAPSSPTVMSSQFSDWGSPSGKLDWGIQEEELNKLRKSASFGFRNSRANSMGNSVAGFDVPWVRSFDKDEAAVNSEKLYRLNSGGSEMIPSWVEQLYMEQEQMVA